MKTEYQLQVISSIKKIREEKGISQLSLSQYLCISPGQMGNIDSSKQPHKYTLKQLMSICDWFGISIEQILFSTNDKKHSTHEIINAIIKYQDKN